MHQILVFQFTLHCTHLHLSPMHRDSTGQHSWVPHTFHKTSCMSKQTAMSTLACTFGEMQLSYQAKPAQSCRTLKITSTLYTQHIKKRKEKDAHSANFQ
uniref:Uncharacterized protein n=1 Tax=Rhipicephalus zambeziensis TaxID=60191 RepID=A0A224Y795_9ACAR